MNCLIVDDEPLAREILESYVNDIPGLECAGSCKTAMEALALLGSEEIDLLFLDVNMPGLSGIELLKAISAPPPVVLTTAYPEYALEGYELNVIDYLLKPIPFDRFLKAVMKVQNRSTTTGSTGRTIMVKADKKIWPVDVADILYLEASGDYVTIHTRSRKILTHDTLRNLENKLPNGMFLRVHKSWIVAPSAVDYLEGNMLHIKGRNIPVGKTYREALTGFFPSPTGGNR
ncbi:MAG: LytTR family DNA-binding domain-containing protein [Rhodothermaceae bacterium]|nr:LytTR family DNA-binding domain-containing protein [Rhodothermaceae bacterium]